MTRNRQILPLLIEGCYSLEAIAQKTGYTLIEVRTTVQALRRSGCAETVNEPTKYKATARGVEALSKKTKTPPDVIARKVQERKIRQGRRSAEAMQIIGSALDSQPALAQVWR